jgi:hypothetical protein
MLSITDITDVSYGNMDVGDMIFNQQYSIMCGMMESLLHGF